MKLREAWAKFMHGRDPVEDLLNTKTLNTRRAYAYAWKLLKTFLAHDPIVCTDDEAGAFGEHLRRSSAPRTYKLRISACHSIFAALKRRRIVEHNPFDEACEATRRVRQGYVRPTEATRFDDVSQLFAELPTDTPEDKRNRSMLACAYGGGLRISEWRNLRVSDVLEDASGVLYLRLRETKTELYAEQVLPAWAAAEVRACLEMRRLEGAGRDDYIHVRYYADGNAKPGTLDERTARRVFNRLTGHSPHSARATAITKLLADGLDHREVQEFSRHRSVQSVEQYDKRAFGRAASPALKLDYRRKKDD